MGTPCFRGSRSRDEVFVISALHILPPPSSLNNPLHYLLRSVCTVVRLSELASRFTLLKYTGFASISLFSVVSSAKKRTNSTLQPALDSLEDKTSHKEEDGNKITHLDNDDLFLIYFISFAQLILN